VIGRPSPFEQAAWADLAASRAKLRSQIAASPLTHAALHILQLQQAYRRMRRDWWAAAAH